jgi:hypothetical protein
MCGLCLCGMGCGDNSQEERPTHESGERIAVSLEVGGGYFTKQAGIKILEATGMAPSDAILWESLVDSDTVGKYAPNEDPRGYIACIETNSEVLGDPVVLLELKSTYWNSALVLAKERYFHGNYNCCWDRIDDGFRGRNGYAFLDMCGTGSNICEAYTFVFQHVRPQDSLDGLVTKSDSWWENDRTIKSGQLEMKGDTLTVNYADSIGIVDEQGKWKTYRVEKYRVSYLLQANGWHPIEKRRPEKKAKK